METAVVESKDSFIASKILVDFLRDFTLLTEQQLVSIRVLMERTVADVMDSVTSMSNVADQKKILSQQSDDSLRRDYLEDKLMRTGGLFSKHMEAISGLDRDLQNLIAKII